jgi:hypothetical protein
MFRFRKQYVAIALVLFYTEILIALYVNDRFVRPFGGDFLVIILLYCIVMGFTHFQYLQAAASVLIFSFLIEVLQYYQIVRLLGLENVKLASVVIGTSFSWADILAYTAGIVFVILFETKFKTYENWNTL